MGNPVAAPAHFPYRHRTVEQVDRAHNPRTPLYEQPIAGRYKLSAPKTFTALCGHVGCDHTVTAFWGESGSARAATILRAHGWQMRGLTNRARWFCPDHKIEVRSL